jgi:glycosyltransferase involved in cell wall biosynthesis
MRIVSLINPYLCGAYQVHLNLLHSLAKRGCSLTWLCSGVQAAELNQAGGFERSPGDLIAPDTADMSLRTRALRDRLIEISPDALLCHAIGDKTDFNAIRYFPESIPKILILHNTTVAHYRAARAVRDYVNATVAISKRIEQDLLSSYGFHGDQMKFIPNGVDLTAYHPRITEERTTDRARILVHSRISHAQKGAFWVPEILGELARKTDKWECTISGDGVDLPELRQRIVRKGLNERVSFAGWTAPEEVPSLMQKHDIFLFPSKYEGYPIALIEAMAGGCVPVASMLPGITDSIVQHGVNGFLFSIGDVREAARLIADLISNPCQLGSLSHQAQTFANQNSLDIMSGQYYEFISEVVKSPGRTLPPESIERCELANHLRPAWWNRLPEPVKDRLRVVRESIRTHVSVP